MIIEDRRYKADWTDKERCKFSWENLKGFSRIILELKLEKGVGIHQEDGAKKKACSQKWYSKS